MNNAPHLVVLCIKEHEFNQLKTLLQADKLGGYTVEPVPTPNAGINDLYLKSKWVLKNGGVPRLYLTLCSFGHLQGPVEASGRAAQIITIERPDYISMVGIAGGRRLGDVTMAVSAAAPEDGHVEKGTPTTRNKASTPGYVLKARSQGQWKSRAEWGADQNSTGANSLMNSYMETFNNDARFDFEVHQGVFFSYSQVRNDVELELARLRDVLEIEPEEAPAVHDVIDMEGYAVLRMANLLGVKIVPIFKGISDVGAEIMDEAPAEGLSAFDQGLVEHNKAQLDKYVPAEVTDHTKRRKLYRKHAGQNAAKAFLAFIEAALREGNSWFSTVTPAAAAQGAGAAPAGGAGGAGLNMTATNTGDVTGAQNEATGLGNAQGHVSMKANNSGTVKGVQNFARF